MTLARAAAAKIWPGASDPPAGLVSLAEGDRVFQPGGDFVESALH